MPSSSLRWRVTSVVVAVAALLVVSVGVVVDVVLEHQLEHQLNAQMSVHAQRACAEQSLPASTTKLEKLSYNFQLFTVKVVVNINTAF